MNRRAFIGLFGLTPLLDKVEIEELKLFTGKWSPVRDVTHFLVPMIGEDGVIVYDTNIYGDYHKLICEYVVYHLTDIHKSVRLRFESKKIYVGGTSEFDRADFLARCKTKIDFKKFKPVTEVSEIVTV